jgi:hypothetical protein
MIERPAKPVTPRTREQVTKGEPATPINVREAAAPVARVRSRATPDLQTKQATLTVDVQRKVGGQVAEERSETRTREMPMSAGNKATVGVSGRATWQPVKYESLTVGVSIFMPCEPTFEAADAMYQECSDWVSRCIEREIAVARGESPAPLVDPE